MVPCFDEPEYKAVWNVTVIHPNGTAAISNGLEMSETIETYTKRGTRIRVWSGPLITKKRMGNALKAAVACYNLFEEYFGINDVVVKQ
ncbi:hypothetical protein NECAME_18318, partial [Necator americanus]